MKKTITAIACFLCLSVAYASDPVEVNEKVLKVFNETFADVKNPEWSEVNGEFTVRFVRNEIDTRITYDEEANIVSSIRYYKGKHLPAIILGKLNRRYEEMKVFGVTELTNQDGIQYHITLESNENWMVVVSDEQGSMRVQKKFKKA